MTDCRLREILWQIGDTPSKPEIVSKQTDKQHYNIGIPSDVRIAVERTDLCDDEAKVFEDCIKEDAKLGSSTVFDAFLLRNRVAKWNILVTPWLLSQSERLKQVWNEESTASGENIVYIKLCVRCVGIYRSFSNLAFI